jgi:hypothetical protein
MFNLRGVGLAACLFLVSFSAQGASPALSVTLVAPAWVQVSWPSNFTRASWQLVYTTNLVPASWQPVPLIPLPLANALVVRFPLADLNGYFRLQQVSGGGGCLFQATPAVLTAGDSSTLTWCPQPGSTYSLSPGPGTVTGSSFSVSPANTTVYSLTASNAFGVITNFTTVVVSPCGWLQVKTWDAKLYFNYYDDGSASEYHFSISHSVGLVDDITFHLTLQAGSTTSDATYFGYATGGNGSMNDREDDKPGPQVFTTTEVGSGPPVLNVSYLSLHVTCTSYDFSYSVLINTTETSEFGVITSLDGLGAGAIASRPLPGSDGKIEDGDFVPAQYPPSGGDYFSPDSDLGKAAFTVSVLPSDFGKELGPLVQWEFTPVP